MSTFSFRLAEKRRRRLTLCHKKNILIEAGNLWQDTVDDLARNHPEVAVEKVAKMAEDDGRPRFHRSDFKATGQQRLLDVAFALGKYQELGITHFALSDTPYRTEITRVGDNLLPLLREEALASRAS